MSSAGCLPSHAGLEEEGRKGKHSDCHFLPVVPFADDHEIRSSEMPRSLNIPQRREEAANLATQSSSLSSFDFLYYVCADREALPFRTFDPDSASTSPGWERPLPAFISALLLQPRAVFNRPLVGSMWGVGDLGWVPFILNQS